MPSNIFSSLWPAAAAATAWCLGFGLLLWFLGTNRGGLAALLCFAPTGLALVLSLTSQQDHGQYLARLLACAGFLPVLQLMAAFTDDSEIWRAPAWLLGGLTACLVLGFVGGVIWMARSSTAIAAKPGVMQVDPQQLGMRLQSLATLDLPLRLRVTVQSGATAAHWEVELHDPAEPERQHRVLLEVDADSVTVRERLAASGAAPRTASEASMRAPGDPAFDPARPRAQGFSSRTAQTTIVEPTDLDRVQLQWGLYGTLTSVVMPPVARDPAQPGHDKGMRDEAQAWLTLLAAVVTQSGYHWRPTMF